MINCVNKNTYNLLFSDYHNLPQIDQGSYENEMAYYTIDYFTKLKEKNKGKKNFFNNKLINLNKISFNKKTKQYIYRNKNLLITFNKLSDCFNDMEVIKELTSEKRYHKCHIKSVNISSNFKKSKIVTGYATIGNEKFLHSVVEYESYGQNFILDWTINLKITKEQYIKLTDFEEITSLNSEEILDELKIFNSNINLKVFLLFRDELIKDMQKNSHIFNINQEKKLIKKKN